MNPRLLYCGVDTLEASFDGELAEGMADLLDAAKLHAQTIDGPVPFMVGTDTFYMSPKGLRMATWLLADRRMQLRLSQGGNIPVASVRLWASALATYGHAALYDQACALLASLGAIVPLRLSRLDLCMDVQGFDFTDQDAENLVSAASYRAVHKDGEGVTYQTGKGDVVMRIYRKDAELRAKGHTSYAEVWKPAECYDPESPVWRIEVQLRGSVIKELAARSVETAFADPPGLFGFGLSWCQLRVPSGDATKTRWPVDPRWTALAALWGDCVPRPRLRQAARMESEERNVSRLLGAFATFAAYSGRETLIENMQLAHFRIEQRLHEEGLDFADLVAKRATHLAAKEGIPF